MPEIENPFCLQLVVAVATDHKSRCFGSDPKGGPVDTVSGDRREDLRGIYGLYRESKFVSDFRV